MPITIDCPNCDKTLRINDSAAGKKVKCPKCQESFRVPAEPIEEDEPAEEEEAAEERPARREKPKKSSKSKGKSKKKAGNNSLVFGLGIGGGALVLLLVVGIIWWATRDKADTSRGPAQAGGPSNFPPGNNQNPGGSPQQPGQNLSQPIKVTAVELTREFKSNEMAAESKYKHGQILEITGDIQSIHQLAASKIDWWIDLRGDGNPNDIRTPYVSMIFPIDSSAYKLFSTLKEGQTVTIKGTFDNGSTRRVRMVECEFLNPKQ